MNNRCGLVSISFRDKSADEIISLCTDTGVTYIEWGGDVHCPVGDIERAKELSVKTSKAGLIPHCYGSYFRLGISPVCDFKDVCQSATALGAKTVRIWAYNKKYPDCIPEEISRIESEAASVFSMAKEYGLCINFEYHRRTLTETIDGALKLFSSLDKDVLRIHWQPNPEITAEDNMRELSLLPRIDIIHVFAWTYENGDNIRHPLYNHHITWKDYIQLAKEKNPDCIFELEFFKGDSFEQCIEDTKILSELTK